MMMHLDRQDGVPGLRVTHYVAETAEVWQVHRDPIDKSVRDEARRQNQHQMLRQAVPSVYNPHTENIATH